MSHRKPPDPGAAPRIFSYEYYEKLYDLEQRHWWQAGMRGLAGRLLQPELRGAPERVLDAGCGTGSMLSWLGEAGVGGSVVGIDLSSHALQFCRRRGARGLAEASITQLPFAEGTFDLVLCLDIIQHLPRDGGDLEALRQCRRVLRPGGLVYLRTNVRLARENGAHGGGEAADYHQYTREELRQLVERSGLSVRRLTYANMIPALMHSLLSRPRKRPGHHGAHQDRGLAVRVPAAPVNQALRLVMGFESWLLGAWRALPYGHSLVCVAAREPASGDRTP